MKAIVIGATGLVGKAITESLLINNGTDIVQVFVRRSTGLAHPKLIEKVVDFEKMDEWKAELKGDILFSALGTTLKASGSKAGQ